jgi:hypothetical protein
MYSKIGLAGVFMSIMLVSGAMAANMVANPDFLVDTEGYSIGADYATLSVDGAGIVGNAMLATINSVGENAWEPEIHSPTFDLVNGTTYTYAFWAKTEPGATRDLAPQFEQLDTWVGLGEGITVTDQWVDYHFTGVWEHPSSPPQVVVHIGFEFLLEDVWFSHFRVYEGDYVEEGLAPVTPVGRLATSWAAIKSR